MKSHICDRCNKPMTRPNILRVKWAAGERTRLELCDECAEKIHSKATERPPCGFADSLADALQELKESLCGEGNT